MRIAARDTWAVQDQTRSRRPHPSFKEVDRGADIPSGQSVGRARGDEEPVPTRCGERVPEALREALEKPRHSDAVVALAGEGLNGACAPCRCRQGCR